MTTHPIAPVGTILTMSKQISDADVALFTLVTTDQPAAPEEPSTPAQPGATEPQGPVVVPNAFVAALLAAAAAAHAGGQSNATLTHAEIACLADAHTEDTLTASAELIAADPNTRALRVRAHCVNQQGTRLAEATFDLRASA